MLKFARLIPLILILSVIPFVSLSVILSSTSLSASEDSDSGVSASSPSWLGEWTDPSAELRPMQIIHGYYRQPGMTIGQRIRFLADDCGLGGVVTSVPLANYLQDEQGWLDLAEAIRSAKASGLRVWIYDEDAYPSLAAGGLVLRQNPDLEARELVYDAAAEAEGRDPFSVRPCFEYTHACNNYAFVRRYPSLVRPEAGAAFIRLTHQAYKENLPQELFDYVEAFFTDEPSTNAMNTGLLPDKIRSRVKTFDQVDPDKPCLPMVVWESDFPEQYKQMYNEDLLAVRKSLFTGDSDADRKVRRQFWKMVAVRAMAAYYEPIQNWCHENGKASSGHTLWEEGLLYHVPLDGDKLETLKRLDIPGLDCLSSTPGTVMYYSWKSASLANSAAILNGGRKVMTEVSDHDFKMAERGPAPVSYMNATAAWQAAFGVTEFTLYYSVGDRSPEEYHRYCTFVGRLNALVRDAKPIVREAVYYPIADVQEEFIPSKDKPALNAQSPKMKSLCESFYRIGEYLTRRQRPFVYVSTVSDMEQLLLNTDPDRKIERFYLPNEASVSDAMAEVIKRFEQLGGRVIREPLLLPDVLTPQVLEVVRGEFRRSTGEWVEILVNVSETETWTGVVTTVHSPSCQILDPDTGTIETSETVAEGLKMTLKPLETRIIVER